MYSLVSKKGICNCNTSPYNNKKDSIDISFKIDESFFKELKINYEVLNESIQKYAYINPACKIISIDSRNKIRQTNLFYYPKGLSHQLDYKIETLPYTQSFFRLDLNTKIGKYEYQICISYQDSWLTKSDIKTYSNYDELIFGGSLEQGVINGLKLAFIKIIGKQNIDLREFRKELILIAVIKGKNFVYSGATRTKLNMPKVRKEIKEFIAIKTLSYLAENKNVEEKIIHKFMKHEE